MPTLERLEQGVIAAERPHALNLRDPEITYYDLPELLSSDRSELVVLECGEELLGCGYPCI